MALVGPDLRGLVDAAQPLGRAPRVGAARTVAAMNSIGATGAPHPSPDRAGAVVAPKPPQLFHEERQAAYAATRPKLVPYPTIVVRLHLADGTVLDRPYIGLSAAVAEHPQAWRVEDAAEADKRAGGG